VRISHLLAFCLIGASPCVGYADRLPSLDAATHIEVADFNHRLLRRITSRRAVAAITALIDAQDGWHGPSWEEPVGSLQLTFHTRSHTLAFLEYGPGWLLRGLHERPYYTRLSHGDDAKLLRLLDVRREDLP
jgi:hypothetical protein